MADLWLPAKEHDRMLAGRRAQEARVLQQVELTEAFRHWNRELKKIDPYVEIVKAPENASLPGLKPGYYHILRRPPVGHPALVVHQYPNGEFRDLDSGLFQTLRDGDMWNDQRERDRKKAQREAERAQARASEREREERIEEVMDRAKAAWAPGVSFTGTNWTAKAGARHG